MVLTFTERARLSRHISTRVSLLSITLMAVWAKIEATLTSSGSDQRPLADLSSWARQPPPLPSPTVSPSIPLAPVAAPVKLKLKTPKAVSSDASSQMVAPMGPPPVPVHRSKPTTAADNKKRKPASLALDDMLGAEIDAMDRNHHSDSFERMLEPKPKKQKLPKVSIEPPVQKEVSLDVAGSNRAISPEKKKPSREPMRTPRAVSPQPIALSEAATRPQVHYEPPQQPHDLPPTKSNSMPFKLRRARHLIATLQKEPSAIIVSSFVGVSDVQFSVPVDPLLHGCPT